MKHRPHRSDAHYILIATALAALAITGSMAAAAAITVIILGGTL